MKIWFFLFRLSYKSSAKSPDNT